MSKTTLLDIEILTHYWVTSGRFPRDTPHITERIEHFVNRGLLRIDEDGAITGNDEALRPYMDALKAVPLPVQTWTVPS